MAVIAAVTAGVGLAVSGIGAAVAASKAKKDANSARDRKGQAEAQVQSIKDSREDIVNPYESSKDLSSMAENLSGNLSNPFAQLGVATGAAEIQMEQTDIALANTLDTLQATGASAGGATALAQCSHWAAHNPQTPAQQQLGKRRCWRSLVPLLCTVDHQHFAGRPRRPCAPLLQLPEL